MQRLLERQDTSEGAGRYVSLRRMYQSAPPITATAAAPPAPRAMRSWWLLEDEAGLSIENAAVEGSSAMPPTALPTVTVPFIVVGWIVQR